MAAPRGAQPSQQERRQRRAGDASKEPPPSPPPPSPPPPSPPPGTSLTPGAKLVLVWKREHHTSPRQPHLHTAWQISLLRERATTPTYICICHARAPPTHLEPVLVLVRSRHAYHRRGAQGADGAVRARRQARRVLALPRARHDERRGGGGRAARGRRGREPRARLHRLPPRCEHTPPLSRMPCTMPATHMRRTARLRLSTRRLAARTRTPATSPAPPDGWGFTSSAHRIFHPVLRHMGLNYDVR